jgi:hypothetical protein
VVAASSPALPGGEAASTPIKLIQKVKGPNNSGAGTLRFRQAPGLSARSRESVPVLPGVFDASHIEIVAGRRRGMAGSLLRAAGKFGIKVAEVAKNFDGS